jgi:hypothetical protein
MAVGCCGTEADPRVGKHLVVASGMATDTWHRVARLRANQHEHSR